jgi:hypothetical protein
MFELFLAHLIAEYMLQPTPVLMLKRQHYTPQWFAASLAHCSIWILAVVLATGSTLPWWCYLIAGTVHFLLDCTPTVERLMEFTRSPTVRGAVFNSHENELPIQVASLEFSLAAVHEGLARLGFHLLILWVLYEGR